jgi:hypothetical protein
MYAGKGFGLVEEHPGKIRQLMPVGLVLGKIMLNLGHR